ncbi:MAG: PEGA domain-containing protein [Magnetococcales bacterium]|nr:PEGA domain-containing protein [Magnetococcales bacterium]
MHNKSASIVPSTVVKSSPKPLQGTVAVISNPPDAVILVNNEFMGVSPNRFKLNVGEHQLILRKNGYNELSASLDVEPDKILDINVTLDPAESITRSHEK